ncbi:hypothetical protein Ahia01_000365000 [Argonauta hians]
MKLVISLTFHATDCRDFRYANKRDILYMLLGIITSAVQGNLVQVVVIDLGDIIMKLKDRNDVIKRSCDVNDTVADEILLDHVWSNCGYFLIMAAAAFCAGVINVFMFKISAGHQIFSMRQKLLWSIFRQDIEWFNEHTPGKLTSYQSEFMTTITRGLGTNLLSLGQGIFGFIGGFVLAFAYSWRLTLMLLGLFPIISLASFCVAKIIKNVTTQEILAYEEASRISEEVLSSVKTVVAFGGENREYERYDTLLSVSRKIAIKKNIAIGAINGLMYFMIFGYYGFGMWFSDVLVRNHDEKLSHLITALVCVLNSSFVLGQIVPSLGNIMAARITAHKLYKVIDEILHSISFVAEPGNTIALVGASGCGKSTLLQLLQRLYDVSSGTILVGGRNIKEYNIGYFRKLFGVVSQEPVLFATSIAENIRHGNEDATEEDIITAAKEANAHGFISQLPEKYNTLVGESGGQLSGGQKQRIAIARALVRNPRFLLLDEATSALDTESEKIVQSALDKIQSSRTTIVVAHRLSTIQFADMILCFDKGEIVERGTHEELMKEEGLYYSMVLAQEKDLPKGNSFAVMKLNLPEWREITIGVIISIFMGVIIPSYGILIAGAIAASDLSERVISALYVLEVNIGKRLLQSQRIVKVPVAQGGWELIEPTLDELEQKMREAETEPNEGKRKAEALWPIFRIHHQRSRYLYDRFYRRHAISREFYEYCLREGIADKNLIAKCKKQGYENLCCLRCIQTRDTNFQTNCICRVRKSRLEEGKIVEYVLCGCRGYSG